MAGIYAEVGGKHKFTVTWEKTGNWYSVQFPFYDYEVAVAYGETKEDAVARMEQFISEAETALAYLKGM